VLYEGNNASLKTKKPAINLQLQHGFIAMSFYIGNWQLFVKNGNMQNVKSANSSYQN
jgi:hypothetical protein